MPATSVPSINNRRRRRIERELRALHAMQSHMNTRDIVLSVLAIPTLALLCLGVAWKLHLTTGSLPAAIGVALGCGALIWLIGRRWFVIAWLIVMALLVILFEDVPDIWAGDEKPDRKTARRLKLERAIAKREALLQNWPAT
jgi:hypothetical protein